MRDSKIVPGCLCVVRATYLDPLMTGRPVTAVRWVPEGTRMNVSPKHGFIANGSDVWLVEGSLAFAGCESCRQALIGAEFLLRIDDGHAQDEPTHVPETRIPNLEKIDG